MDSKRFVLVLIVRISLVISSIVEFSREEKLLDTNPATLNKARLAQNSGEAIGTDLGGIRSRNSIVHLCFLYADLPCLFDYVDTTFIEEFFHRKKKSSKVFGGALGSCARF